ncbi:unnamed protein product [Porites lobata]|uniref:Transposase n=1 Tax=Porites lobata TaxID=104759 RepID=A0ABN8NRW6_9CNID|nr:unnamed protein product [Porites lobata]
MFSSEEDCSESEDLTIGTKRKVGRPSVIEAHPEIVEIVRDFITQHSSSAHDRRRDDVQYSHGVTLAAIRSHVLREIPALKKISRNDLTSKIHADFHYSSAQVNFVGELAELFSDETIAISADDKNKVNVGTLAVRKKAVTIICDGGPDWSPKSTPNLINFGRLWRDLNLDILILTSYAPGHSRYNPIERSWAPLSRWLTALTT